ncbi:hypothetical protein C1Y63_09675 [Corynebacterium sp. 13CS0277]|uniref:hypothetical protein n=1 Tax=Corynebacterium sp. 13CS0277 TaxID=2071994 RepID=UPI000D0380FE|nr:hypothetical protein [Corynebacterium sp. 13CS0277]PRQ10803.1 hypothetical protein C1Y63_09675 [Corynebacterium sp. 13CS0277]
MARLHLVPGEVIYVNLTTPLLRNSYLVLRAILLTGLVWIGVGFIDNYLLAGGYTFDGTTFPPNDGALLLRRGLLVAWAVLMVTALVIPVWKQQRRRIIVSDRRLLVRSPGFAGAVMDVPLDQILGVARQGSDVQVRILGARRPLVIAKAPKAKRFAESLDILAAHSRGHVPYLRD